MVSAMEMVTTWAYKAQAWSPR